MTHREAVRERLDALLSDRGLEAVWFARPASFTWATGGNNVVDRASPLGVAAAGYDGEEFTVVTDNIEASRLAEEELPDDVTVAQADWFEADLDEAVADVSPTPAAADFDVGGFEDVDPTPLRQPMTDRDVENYRSLGEEAAEVLENVVREAGSDDEEREVGGRLRDRLFARGIESPVVLVGSGKRCQQYRHFTTGDAELGEYAIASITAVRDGLHASVTRTVAFDAPDWLDERTEIATRVEASALAATQRVGRAGGTASDVFSAIQDAYAEQGYEGEWRNHHQGGAAGYAGREWFATPDAENPVHLPMAYAWNPTVQGAKSEDTHLVTEDDIELLTGTGDWPTETVDPVGDGPALERHTVLHK
ncbi:M24 family metallopeptidase [Halosimplex aquaticum]|uniref:M24 family metallopeptidase n=1 Tax=Halosimplex aquaticum TaxID=3026162 RepID=A0ABD5XZF6_9EURY|nr:M24 family metallopeptidase [Halosimplex aquaticum]